MPTPRSILTIRLSKHLNPPIASILARDWCRAPQIAAYFDNIGCDVEYHNFQQRLVDIRKMLNARDWAGVLVGWCLRVILDRAEMFEQVVAVCHEELAGKETRVMVSTGPDNLVETTLRGFPVEGRRGERSGELEEHTGCR
ncbi:hypothetical protein CLAFUW4_07444 [Fulvia fulva]|uniref:Uncharacterized protein n=1 Tax=Passalora fulva TaxID=5499 RepID=A0A9Q8P9Z3_PASFU|nr:uncharacterized protein CLAFUR5_07574 [Fulvia fulva]KAK4622197.1 hypothetical protein CLAFUR4_07451 [Fulvia fulva]KAK4623083.1 hypothetical protein CLAFUR0_07450 [Fulvia fulva]UJO18600.1 hypothetical protein CLAFUR5_07574 [Fulvia fulva]WPV15918.1 hypothetical protein CLAFUW4_07444 [Fulvia fulva]WPV31086.1 hypothetical protein CLAFUW7_07447 [Fulvia fulva]